MVKLPPWRRRRWCGPALGGPLQRGCRFCFAAHDGEVRTSKLAECQAGDRLRRRAAGEVADARPRSRAAVDRGSAGAAGGTAMGLATERRVSHTAYEKTPMRCRNSYNLWHPGYADLEGLSHAPSGYLSPSLHP